MQYIYKKLEGQTIMQNTALKQLSVEKGKPEYDMLQGIYAVENGFTNPAYNLSYDEYKEWLRITDNNSIGKDLPEGWIPFTTYFYMSTIFPSVTAESGIRHPSIWKRLSAQEIWGTVLQKNTEGKDTEVFYSKNY